MFTYRLGMGTGDRFICDTGLSIAVNQSETGPPSTRFGFLCMHRVPGGVIKLSAPTSSLASMSAKRDDQTAISKSRWMHASWTLKSRTLPTFTMLRSLLSVVKVGMVLVYRNFPELSSSGKFSHAFHWNRLGNRDKTEPQKQNREPIRTVEFSTIPIPTTDPRW